MNANALVEMVIILVRFRFSSRAYLFQHLIKQGALADKDAYLQTHQLLPLTYINTTQIANSTNVSNDRVPRMRFCSILLNLMKWGYKEMSAFQSFRFQEYCSH